MLELSNWPKPASPGVVVYSVSVAAASTLIEYQFWSPSDPALNCWIQVVQMVLALSGPAYSLAAQNESVDGSKTTVP